MKSEASQKLPVAKEIELPYMVVIDENIILVDNDLCAVCVYGPKLGKFYGECEYEWSKYPIYKGKVTLSN